MPVRNHQNLDKKFPPVPLCAFFFSHYPLRFFCEVFFCSLWGIGCLSFHTASKVCIEATEVRFSMKKSLMVLKKFETCQYLAFSSAHLRDFMNVVQRQLEFTSMTIKSFVLQEGAQRIKAASCEAKLHAPMSLNFVLCHEESKP